LAQDLCRKPARYTHAEEIKTAEFDGVFIFIGNKKNRIYVMTIVDCAIRCILGWKLIWERTEKTSKPWWMLSKPGSISAMVLKLTFALVSL
jgi:hypothetical protein